MRLLPIAAFVLAAASQPALAGSSVWFETDGARLRLVTADLADENGTLRGALEIDLKPGWKTYWRDPGDAGIPPQLDVSASMNVAAAEISFPPPRRFDDGFSTWAGYDAPVTLPVRFKVPDPAKFSSVEADVFLGICKEVCIPVQARLSVKPESDPEGDAVVAAAFAGLPARAAEGFRLESLTSEGQTFVASAVLPDPSNAQLFLVTPPGWVLGTPEPLAEGGTFSIPVVERPAKPAPAPVAVDYTLVSGNGSVSGSIPLE